MEINKFIEELKKLHLYLVAENGKLVLKGDRKKINSGTEAGRQEIINYITQHKDDLLHYLSETEQGTDTKKSPDITAIYRLSPLQEGMLFHELYDNTTTAYTMQMGCDFGQLDTNIFKIAWEQLVKTHSILRTGFHYDRFNIPVQCVYRQAVMPIEVLDCRNSSEQEKEQMLAEREEADRVNGFVLEQAPLMRFTLLRLGDTRWRMIWTWHHLLLDGWSGPVLIEKFLKLYESLAAGHQVSITEEDNYEDYIRYIERRDKDQEENYWQSYLGKLTRGMLLPFINLSSAERTRKKAGLYTREALFFDERITGRIKAFCRRSRITINTLVQGTWAFLLSRYTGRNDVVYGVTVSGRPEDLRGVEQRIGMFINTLPLCTSVHAEGTVSDWLQQLQQDQLQSRTFQYTSLSDIQGWTGIGGDLFDSIIVFENYPISKMLGSGQWSLRATNISSYDQNNYPLTIAVEAGEEINIFFDHDRLLDDVYAREIRDHFEYVLLQMIRSDDQSIADIEWPAPAERNLLVKEFTSEWTGEVPDKTLVDLFEEQVIRTPDAAAVIYGKHSLSYKELDERANQLAHYLKSKGVGAEMLIPLCIGRETEMIVGLLGIMKAGGAYVPIDPTYPEKRIRYMLDDTNAGIVLCSHACRHLVSGVGITCVELDIDRERIAAFPVDKLSGETSPHQLAYVIYTSGSTGTPKGVLIEHKGVVNMVLNHIDLIGLRPGLRILQFASFGFDGSCQEIFNTLCSGGTLIGITNEQLLSAAQLGELIQEAHVDIATLPPSYQQAVKDYIDGLKILYSAGEPLQPVIARHILSKGIRLLNGYGPTENSVTATLTEQPLKEDGRVLIGRPLRNVSIYILDDTGMLVPPGVPGELCLDGIQQARGYLNRPDLEEEKFIPDPFSARPGARLYKTGDLGRWFPDGNIEYLGRKDDQVKIRGYRIEPGEVEFVLCQAPGVLQAAVVVKEDEEGHKQLAGFVVAQGPFDKNAVHEYLREQLPAYMVPALLYAVDHLPLTPNGKVDRRQLQKKEMGELTADNAPVAARSKMEEIMLGIWRELLSNERLGIYDNFFEAGGDSIIAIQVVSRFRRAGYEMQLQQLFTYQTISKLSEALGDGRHTSRISSAEPGLLTGVSGLLPIQQWYFEQVHIEDSWYNQAVLLQLTKTVTPNDLAEAVKKLTLLHDALRFRYDLIDRGWVQEYGDEVAQLHTVDLSAVTPSVLAEQISAACAEYQQKVDIRSGELLQAILFQTPESEQNNRLLLAVHHLAIDGVSWRILLGDLELLLSGEIPDEKGSSYREWFNALSKYGQSQRLLSQRPYWTSLIKRYSPLPSDEQYAGLLKAKDIRGFTNELSAAQTSALLQEVPRVYNTEINDLLLAALSRTISRWSNKEQVIIGLEGHGREELSGGVDVSRTVGWFTSVYPVLLEVNAAMPPAEVVKQVKEQLRAVPDRGIGFGVLRYLNRDASLQRQHCWNIGFNYLGQADNVLNKSKWLSAATESAGAAVSDDIRQHEKLFINCIVQNGQLRIAWGYSSRHYRPETIESLAQSFIDDLTDLIGHCQEIEKTGLVRTPSDFGLIHDVSWKELDVFLDKPVNGIPRRAEVESMCRLSALQEGMLFHSLFDSRSEAYVMQLSYVFTRLDIGCFKESWTRLFRHHSILRSAFFDKEFAIPVQCVFRHVDIPLEERDLRGWSAGQQSQLAWELEQSDRAKGFDLSTAPLMRFTILHLTDNTCRMIWTYHHLLFDGWSGSVLIAEFVQTYEALLAGKRLPAQEEDRYEDYIRYIEKRDREQEQLYWHNYLQGLVAGTSLSGDQLHRTADVQYFDESLPVGRETTMKLEAYAQQHRITISTIIQGVWAYLLHRYTGSNDVVYGVTVSGRPEDLPRVEQRIGTYINTLPLRARINNQRSIVAWLQELQQDQMKSRTFQYASINDIRNWAGIKGDLFDNIIVFENYPVTESITSGNIDLKTEIVASFEQNNYPLSISVMTGDTITIVFSYNASLFQKEDIHSMAIHFGQVLQSIVKKEEKLIEDLDNPLPGNRPREEVRLVSDDLFDFESGIPARE